MCITFKAHPRNSVREFSESTLQIKWNTILYKSGYWASGFLLLHAPPHWELSDSAQWGGVGLKASLRKYKLLRNIVRDMFPLSVFNLLFNSNSEKPCFSGVNARYKRPNWSPSRAVLPPPSSLLPTTRAFPIRPLLTATKICAPRSMSISPPPTASQWARGIASAADGCWLTARWSGW